MWLTWANVLTGARALLALPCAWLTAQQRWVFAALLLSVAVLTDLLDGPLARRLRQNSALGGLADHATDAFFVTALLISLWTLDLVPWLLPLLVAASFAQYVTDSRAHRGGTLRASWLGRCNGIGYFALAALAVYGHALGLRWPPAAVLQALSWLLVLTTLLSMLDRFRAWRCAPRSAE